MQSTFSVSTFLRDLLTRCIGGVMIEPEQWNFPNDGFDRGFFNTRLKQDKPANSRTHKRLIFVFSHLFAPENRTNRDHLRVHSLATASERISGRISYRTGVCSKIGGSEGAGGKAAQCYQSIVLQNPLSIFYLSEVVPAF